MEFYQGLGAGAVLVFIAAVIPLWSKIIFLKRRVAGIKLQWDDDVRYFKIRIEQFQSAIMLQQNQHDERMAKAQADQAQLQATIDELKKRPVIPDEIEALAEHVRPMMEDIEKRDGGQSGEWKRHQVYARLIKDLPYVSHWKLALAIEVAFWRYFASQAQSEPHI